MSIRARDLFEQALDLLRDQRPRFVEQACAGDKDLLKEVQSLLAAHDASEEFMDPVSVGAALGAVVSDEQDPLIGQTVGRYRILSLINRGGMGAVFKAEQDRPRRQVAVKLIDRVFASPELLRRFEIEAEVLGRLQHPSIAQILESGSTNVGGGSRPYFAMELVDGLPLDGYARAHDLSVRDRLVLMIRICEAVQHAHRSGVIHRDLKPANILVTADGVPKILDFGVARVSDPDLAPGNLQTADGMVLGTLPYMSPEQLTGQSGAVDTRSDVYALGVVLYELLTGQLPRDLKGMPLVEAARTVSETDPRPLEAPGHFFPPDLATIAAKALEGDPDRRYGSASELADDLKRFLDNQPIAARPATGLYHVRKLMSRHRLATGLVGALVMVVAAFGIMMGVQANRIADQRDRAELEADTARQVSEYLQELFVAPDPWAAGGDELTARDLLDRGRERIDEDLEGQPELQARMRMILGKTYHGLGEGEAAGELLAQAVEQAAEPALRMEAKRYLSWWYRDQGRDQEAVASARQALEISEAEFGPESKEVATDLSFLGAVLRDAGQVDEAAPMLERSVEIRRQLLGQDHPDTGWSLFHLGWLRQLQEDGEAAEELYSEACSIMEAGFGAESPNTAVCLGDWAKVLAGLDRLDEARDKLEASLAIRNQAFPSGHPETANGHTDLGYLFWRMGDFQAAGEQYQAAFRIREDLFGENHLITLESILNLVLVQERSGNRDRAEQLSLERLDRTRQHYGQDVAAVSRALYSHSTLLVRLGKMKEAITGHRELVAMLPIDRGDTRRAAGVRYALVSLLVNPEQAEEVLMRIGEIESVLSARPELTYPPPAGVRFYKARALMMLDRDPEAEPLLEEAVRLQTEAAGEEHFRVAESTWLLGLCRWRQGVAGEGTKDLHRAADILMKVQGDNGRDHLFYRSILLAKEGRSEEAAGTFKAAMDSGLQRWRIRLQRNLHPADAPFPGS